MSYKSQPPSFINEIINIPLGPSIGQCCGGYVQIKLDIYKNGIEALQSEKYKNNSIKDLYIFGAGHVGQQLSSRVIDLDFYVNLIDSREDYLNLQTKKLIAQATLSSMKMPRAKAGGQVMKGFKVIVKIEG